jgi:hypothetical protein
MVSNLTNRTKHRVASTVGHVALLMAIIVLALPVRATAQGAETQENPLAHFAVAHQHGLSWCLGYLYIYSDSISYEVIRPSQDKSHSFKIKRSELQGLGRWIYLGVEMKALELKSGKSVYHFWWLPNEQDVLNGRPYRFNPPDAADPATLIAAIRDPSTLGGNPATNPLVIPQPASSPASYPDGSGASQPLPPGISRPAASVPPQAAPNGLGVPPGMSQSPTPGPQPSSSQTFPLGPQPSSGSQTAGVQPEPQRSLPSGAMEGVYIGYFLSSGFKLARSYLIFNPDGWVAKGMPEAGMEGFDFTAYRESPTTNKSWVGRYRLDGNDINIIWQDYPDDRQAITRNESGTAPGLGKYVPTCRCTGKRFSGVYIWGPPTSQQYLQFLVDGTFLDNGLIDTITVSGPYYDNPRMARGTYSIQDRTLTLKFADGRILKQTFLAPKAQESEQVFDWIEVNQHAMFERQHQPSP